MSDRELIQSHWEMQTLNDDEMEYAIERFAIMVEDGGLDENAALNEVAKLVNEVRRLGKFNRDRQIGLF